MASRNPRARNGALDGWRDRLAVGGPWARHDGGDTARPSATSVGLVNAYVAGWCAGNPGSAPGMWS